MLRASAPTRAAIAVGAAAAALFLVGLVRFAAARPAIETRFVRLVERPSERANLALFPQGPTVRASSVEWALRHHPGYLVDGHRRPTLVEKWVSARSDREPWIEVALDRAADLDEVALELAGARESAGYTMRSFRIDCLRGAALVASLPVTNNDDARPRRAVACPQVDRVRVTFQTEPGTPRDIARVYELEVWGR